MTRDQNSAQIFHTLDGVTLSVADPLLAHVFSSSVSTASTQKLSNPPPADSTTDTDTHPTCDLVTPGQPNLDQIDKFERSAKNHEAVCKAAPRSANYKCSILHAEVAHIVNY